MTRLFNRSCSVDVDGVKITGLRIAFKIVKSLSKDPNTLDLGIYNLAESSRRNIQKTSNIKVIAGYVGEVDTLFVGDATIVNHISQGPDWLTNVQCGDGVRACREARCSESFESGTNIVDAMKRIADTTGLSLGNLIDEASKGNVRNTLTQFAKGYVASGPAVEELTKLAKTLGKDLSIQDGALQLSHPEDPVGDQIVNLRADTGLIGSPEVAQSGEGKTKKTVLKVRSLIQQKLLPGRRVRVESRAITGFFRIEKVCYTGDTHAQPWYADLELNALKI